MALQIHWILTCQKGEKAEQSLQKMTASFSFWPAQAYMESQAKWLGMYRPDSKFVSKEYSVT